MRADLSRTALRAIGVLGLCGVALTSVNAWNFRRPNVTEEVFESVGRVARIVSWIEYGVFVALIVALALLAFARPKGRGRALAITAVVLDVVALAVRTWWRFAADKRVDAPVFKYVYLALAVATVAAIALAMLSRTEAKRRVPIAMATAGVALACSLAAQLIPSDKLYERLTLYFMLLAVSDLALGVGPLLVAAGPSSDGERATAATGAPLRTLASAFGVRLAASIGAVILTTVSLATKNAELASMWAGLAAVISLACTIAIIVALVRHLRSDAPGMLAGNVVFAIIAAVIAVVIDLWATTAGIELFDLIGKAQSATSFWGMPSLSKIEQLQDTVRWGSRLQIGIGVAGSIALAMSLRSSALARGAGDAAALAVRVMWLAVAAAVAALGIGALMERPRGLGEELLFIALAALGLGVWLIVSWFSLLREVARALDVSAEPTRAAS